MAQGSHKKWGGWETKLCAVCHGKIVLSRGHAMHSFIGPFSLCGLHISHYGRLVRELERAA